MTHDELDSDLAINWYVTIYIEEVDGSDNLLKRVQAWRATLQRDVEIVNISYLSMNDYLNNEPEGPPIKLIGRYESRPQWIADIEAYTGVPLERWPVGLCASNPVVAEVDYTENDLIYLRALASCSPLILPSGVEYRTSGWMAPPFDFN